MLAAPSGAAGFTARHYTAVLSGVLSLTGIATGTAAALAFTQSVSLIAIVSLAASAVLAMAIAFWQTRHGALAVLAATVPLPGLIWAAPLSSGSSFAAVPVLAYGFAYAVAALYAHHLLDRVLTKAQGEAPWIAAAVVLSLAVVLAAVWFRNTEIGDAALQAVADMVLATASVLLVLPLATARLQFDEAFVTEANRARERRGRITERLGAAAVPPWGLSFSGIAVVFLALGWFGAEPMLRESWWRHAFTVVLVCGVLSAFTGGWREGLGLGFVMAIALLLTLWWQSYGSVPFGAVIAFQAAMVAGLLALSGGRRMRLWRRAGEAPELVRRRAIEEAGGAVFAALGASAAALPLLLHLGAPVVVLSVLVAGLSGALLFPAILTGLDTLLPRRRSVAEIFHTTRQR